MQILIGCAKDMVSTANVAVPFLSTPRYLDEARHNAMQMMGFDAEALQKMLGISAKLSGEVYRDAGHGRVPVRGVLAVHFP